MDPGLVLFDEGAHDRRTDGGTGRTRRALDVGDVGLDLVVVVGVERQGPDLLARRLADLHHAAGQVEVAGHHGGILVPERATRRARQRRDVHEELGVVLVLRVGHGVGE